MPVALLGARQVGKFCGTLEGMGNSVFADEEIFFHCRRAYASMHAQHLTFPLCMEMKVGKKSESSWSPPLLHPKGFRRSLPVESFSMVRNVPF